MTQRGATPLTILVFTSKLQGLLAIVQPPRHSPVAVALRPSMTGIENGLPKRTQNTLSVKKCALSGDGNQRRLFLRRNLNPTAIFDLLNPKSIGFDVVSRTTAVPSFKSFGSAVFVSSC